ncbi:MAG: hypothetical protein M3376_06125 [Actinomycetota bacterium]|nr:hypothetical protein [Actinomycetota bacterium]
MGGSDAFARAGRPARRALTGLACVLLCSPAPGLAASVPAPDPAVAQLNAWRASVGVPPVRHDQELSRGCRSHAAYHRVNSAFTGHSEAPSAPGYSESGDRAARTSVLAYDDRSVGGIADWEPAPYHRIALLEPRLVASGFWREFGLSCMNVGRLDAAQRTADLTAYTYPANGQEDVPTTFWCNELPNPCAAVPGNDGRAPSGFNLSVQFNGPWARMGAPLVASATLAPAGGAPLAVTVQSRESLLRRAIVVIPHEPLTAGTTYVAAASGSVAATADDATPAVHPFAVSWSFSTPGTTPSASLKVSVERVTAARVHLRLDLLSGEARQARISLSDDRKTLVRLDRQIRGPSERISLPRPRERVTSISVLLRSSAEQIGVTAHLPTDIASAGTPPVTATRAARSRVRRPSVTRRAAGADPGDAGRARASRRQPSATRR